MIVKGDEWKAYAVRLVRGVLCFLGDGMGMTSRGLLKRSGSSSSDEMRSSSSSSSSDPLMTASRGLGPALGGGAMGDEKRLGEIGAGGRKAGGEDGDNAACLSSKYVGVLGLSIFCGLLGLCELG